MGQNITWNNSSDSDLSLSASLAPSSFSSPLPCFSSLCKEILVKQTKLGEKLPLVPIFLTQQAKAEIKPSALTEVLHHLSEQRVQKSLVET